MNDQTRKGLMIAGIVVVLLAIIGGIVLYTTSPVRTMNAFYDAIEAQDEEAAYAMVREGISEDNQDNIDFFLEDWLIGEDFEVTVLTDEAWRVKEIDEGKKEILPTPKYWSHFFHVYADVEFDEYEDPVIIRFRRKTDNKTSRFAQLFRGWEVTNIDYQPIDEDDEEYYDEFEFDELFEDVDEEGEVEIDVTDDSEEGEEEVVAEDDTTDTEE